MSCGVSTRCATIPSLDDCTTYEDPFTCNMMDHCLFLPTPNYIGNFKGSCRRIDDPCRDLGVLDCNSILT